MSVLPKFKSAFLSPTPFDLAEGQDVINYELPKEFIDMIRKPKTWTDIDSANVYLVINFDKKEN